MRRWMVISGLSLATLAVASAGAQARIVHDGSCPSGYADDTYNKGKGAHVCIPPGHVSPVGRTRCKSGVVVRTSQCVPTWELSQRFNASRGRSPHRRRIVHD